MLSTATGFKVVVISCLAGLLAVSSCQTREGQEQSGAIAKITSEQLIEVDCEFGAMSVDSGAPAAFAHFAADSATVIRRGSLPIVGRESIREIYSFSPAGLLQWEPYFADISTAGDLGYTLGRYQLTVKDTAGVEKTAHGYYVTIWKKQADGKWKFVLDTGEPGPQ